MKNNILGILLIFFIASCNKESNQNEPGKANEPAVVATEQKLKDESFDFVYQDINDKEVKLSDYKGKYVIVNFWATWCKPCRKEIPDFVRFKETYKDKVEILGIDYEDTDLEIVQNFVNDLNINYPILRTDVYAPTDFENANTKGLPTTLVFNPDGEQIDKRVGPVHYEDLVEILGF